MTKLSYILFPPILDTSSGDIIRDFSIPRKTALSASVRLFEREKRLAVIIAVPYQHLVDQWDTESQEFAYRPILAYQSKSSWFDKLNSMVMDFSSGYREHFAVITTHISRA